MLWELCKLGPLIQGGLEEFKQDFYVKESLTGGEVLGLWE